MIHQTHGTTQQAPLTVPETRLLLLMSRPALARAQQSLAAELLAQVENWPAFIDTAWRKFSLPMVYRNLASLPFAAPPEDALETLRSLSLRATLEMLRWQAAFERFHAECVLPSGVDHAYFKGPALAARFYPDPLQRFFRDIDILVPPTAQADTLRFMLDQGCRAFDVARSRAEFLTLDSDSALREFLFSTPVPHVMTPQGLVVELHGEIDQQTGLFDTRALLDSTRPVATQNHCIRALPDTAHITFICYHHTRHLWSKLNWLADLDAICGQRDFDRGAVLAHAQSLRIKGTVQAALSLHDLTSAGGHPSDFERATPGVDLLRACVDGLPGDLELERAMRQNHRMNVIAFDWQPVPVSLVRRAWLQGSRFRPAHEDFSALPIERPRWLRLTLAYLFKFMRIARRRMNRGADA